MLVHLVATKTLIPLFVNSLPVEATLMIWNCFFCNGGEVNLVSAALSLLALTCDAIANFHCTAQRSASSLVPFVPGRRRIYLRNLTPLPFKSATHHYLSWQIQLMQYP